MDLSLWDAPIYEDEISDFGGNSESEFYYDFGRDVIEEDAINKTCCIQVLNRLIPKVDTDIEELEQETMLLHGELAWTDDICSNICTSTLREWVNKLDMSNQRLKNENAHMEPALDFSFQTLGEPPPELSGIIKPLLSNYAPNRDEQNGGTTSTESTTNISEHATDLSTKRKIDDINSGIEMRQGTATRDSDTKAEKRMHTTQIGMETNARVINTSTNTLSSEAGSNSGKGGLNHLEELCGGDVAVVQSFKTKSINSKPSPKPKETTIAETNVLADLSAGCTSNAAKQLATKFISKQKLKMLSDADQSNRIDIPKQSVRAERMRTEFSPLMKQKESWLFGSEPTLGESFSEMLSKKRKVARKPLIKKKQKPQILKQMQSTEVVAMEPSKSNLSLKSGTTELMEKHFPTLDSHAIPEPSLAMEMELNVSSMKSFKRNHMAMILDEQKCFSSKEINETHQDCIGEKILNVASDAGSNSVCQSPENKKKCAITPVIDKNEGLKNLQVIPVVYESTTIALAKEEDQPIAEFSTSTDAGVKPLKLLYCTTSLATVNLNSLTRAQLRAMAKERKLTRYYKLKKSDLVKLLE